MSEADLIARVKALKDLPQRRRARETCELIGHSRLLSIRGDIVRCARCWSKIGDLSKGYAEPPGTAVLGRVSHVDRDNAREFTWRDKVYCQARFRWGFCYRFGYGAVHNSGRRPSSVPQ